MPDLFINITVRFILTLLPLIMICCKTGNDSHEAAVSSSISSIKLSDAQVQLANITTYRAVPGSVTRRLQLTGVIKVNEQTAMAVSARVPGRIEKLFFRNTGEFVSKGDRLYEFYSDELVLAQREYSRLQSNNWNFSASYEPRLAAEERLLIMGMMPSQIEELRKNGKVLFNITIYSPVNGKIRSVNISEGQYVNEGQLLYELADDSTLWVEAQVYPAEASLVRPGMPAKVVVPSAGEKTVKCSISFINPSFEKGQNIILARAVINNPGKKLHPGMLAVLEVPVQISKGIVIPSSAVITDSKGERIWIRETTGEFSPRNIITGLHSRDSAVVLAGLKPDELVVSTGAYLLNSEMILKQGSADAFETVTPSRTAEIR